MRLSVILTIFTLSVLLKIIKINGDNLTTIKYPDIRNIHLMI